LRPESGQQPGPRVQTCPANAFRPEWPHDPGLPAGLGGLQPWPGSAAISTSPQRRPGEADGLGEPGEDEQRYLARLQHSSEAEGGYAIEQATKPPIDTTIARIVKTAMTTPVQKPPDT
jgi:hypothetical protein